jgi:predicted RNase H-like HicB family nuclease
MPQNQRTFDLRCYVKGRPSGRFVAVCLKPNLVVEGSTQIEARQKLDQLLDAYIEEAGKDGQLEHFMAQRAPLHFYVEYWLGRLKRSASTLDHSFTTFNETKRPQHA